MKLAKIMLTVVVFFAIVGGAFAFKLRQENLFYVKTAAAGACNVAIILMSTTTAAGGHLLEIRVAPTTATTCGFLRLTAAP